MGMKYRDPETGQFKDLKVKTSDTLPIGTQVAYGGAVPPTGWLICDGSAVSRTTYAELFKVIGTSYGAGDGSTTFNLPNKKGRVSAGYDSTNSKFNAIGKHLGEETHTLTVQELAEHKHVENIYSHSYNQGVTIPANHVYVKTFNGEVKYSANTPVSESEALKLGDTNNTGGNQAHNNIQPTEVDNWIIKAFQSVGVVGNVVNTKTTSDTDTYSCNYINEILTTKAGIIQKNAEIDNEHTNVSIRKNGNIVTVQGVIYFSNTTSKWTTFMTIPTDYKGVLAYGNLIEETTGKTYPVIVQNNGQVQCSVDITNANAYYYINIVYLI